MVCSLEGASFSHSVFFNKMYSYAFFRPFQPNLFIKNYSITKRWGVKRAFRKSNGRFLLPGSSERVAL